MISPEDILWPCLCGGALLIGAVLGINIGDRQRSRRRKLDRWSAAYEDRALQVHLTGVDFAHAQVQLLALAKEYPGQFDETIFTSIRVTRAFERDLRMKAAAMGIIPPELVELNIQPPATSIEDVEIAVENKPPTSLRNGGMTWHDGKLVPKRSLSS